MRFHFHINYKYLVLMTKGSSHSIHLYQPFLLGRMAIAFFPKFRFQNIVIYRCGNNIARIPWIRFIPPASTAAVVAGSFYTLRTVVW